jgi:hypothetical protein
MWICVDDEWKMNGWEGESESVSDREMGEGKVLEQFSKLCGALGCQ